MLKIRQAQFDALATAQLNGARDVIVAMIWRRRAEFGGEFDLGYVERSVAFAVDRCRRQGLHRIATWSGVAESLFKDEIHPLSPGRRDAKTETILDELAAQSLFANLKAIEAMSASSGAAGPTSDR